MFFGSSSNLLFERSKHTRFSFNGEYSLILSGNLLSWLSLSKSISTGLSTLEKKLGAISAISRLCKSNVVPL